MQTSPVIVTGMHRSGTSFVASLLLSAGVHMGDRLMEPGPGNERGHFENLAFVEFQQQLLRSHGHDDAGLLPSGPTPLLTESFDDVAYAQARQILAENSRTTPWGWKDPRCTLLLDFWARVVPGAFYVLLYREPAEVIASLFRRGDSAVADAPEAAARAWLDYNGILLQFARMNRARCVLANAAVIGRNPQSFLSTVASRFSMELDVNASSPFDASLLHQMDPDSAEPVLLRYLVPETERLFVDLESEADFAAGVHRDSPISPRRARGVFFENWAAIARPEGSEQVAEAERLAQQRESELLEVRALLATADQEMRRAQAAFQQQMQRATESAELLLQLKESSHGAELELVRAQERLHAALQDRDHALSRLDERLTSFATLEARAADASERLHQAELEGVRAREAARLLEHQRDALAEQIESLKLQAAALTDARLQLAMTSEQLRFTARERDTLAHELQGLQTQSAGAQAQLRAVEGERDALHHQLQALETLERQKQLDAEHETLAGRLEELEAQAFALSQAEAKAAEAVARLRELEAERETLHNERETLRKERDTADQRKRDAEGKAESIRGELLTWLDQLEVVTAALQAERELASSEHQKFEAAIAAAEQHATLEIESLRQREAQIVELLEQAQARASIVESRYDSEIDALRTREVKIGESLAQAQAELEEVRREARAAEERYERGAAALHEREADVERLRASHKVLAKTLEDTSSRFLQHVNTTLSQTREEAQHVALLIDEIQSSRFWKIKRALRRLLGRSDTPR